MNGAANGRICFDLCSILVVLVSVVKGTEPETYSGKLQHGCADRHPTPQPTHQATPAPRAEPEVALVAFIADARAPAPGEDPRGGATGGCRRRRAHTPREAPGSNGVGHSPCTIAHTPRGTRGPSRRRRSRCGHSTAATQTGQQRHRARPLRARRTGARSARAGTMVTASDHAARSRPAPRSERRASRVTARPRRPRTHHTRGAPAPGAIGTGHPG